jgi:hypothetical protein
MNAGSCGYVKERRKGASQWSGGTALWGSLRCYGKPRGLQLAKPARARNHPTDRNAHCPGVRPETLKSDRSSFDAGAER